MPRSLATSLTGLLLTVNGLCSCLLFLFFSQQKIKNRVNPCTTGIELNFVILFCLKDKLNKDESENWGGGGAGGGVFFICLFVVVMQNHFLSSN